MIELLNINKKLEGKTILSDFSVKIEENEFITIVGRSGTGKTTLLNIMGLLDKPDEGVVKIFDYYNPDGKTLMNLRRNTFGYIFQNFVLMNNKTVRENLLLSTKYNPDKTDNDIISALSEVHLEQSLLTKKVFQLSGGEQQRLAIARVILKPCSIIFADEPTGNLDQYNKEIVLSLLLKLKQKGKTIICVTHDTDIAGKSTRTITL